MSKPAESLHHDAGAVSPWWLRAVLMVMVLGFSGLIAMTVLAYRHAPPVPQRVVDARAVTLFSGDDIRDGQTVFLKYGLMANGSIWGHGAYLGPDYAADALHRIGAHSAEAVAQQRFGQTYAALIPVQQAAVTAEAAASLKINHFDANTQTLHFSEAQAAAYQEQIGYWRAYFHQPQRNGGLKADLIANARELRQFAAFMTWAAWASVTHRPGEVYSYTNNFPYDPSVGNRPTAGALLWSALSLLVLLVGIAVVLLAFGKFDDLGWISHDHLRRPLLQPGAASAGQKALVKYFVLVALLLLAQALLLLAQALLLLAQALVGVFGMLAIALMVFELRQCSEDCCLGGHRALRQGGVLGQQYWSGADVGPEPVPRWRVAAVGCAGKWLLARPQPGLHRQ